MTRSELIQILAEQFPALRQDDVQVSVTEILNAISAALCEGKRVEIRGFGSFQLNYRPARTGRNPKSGESVSVAPKYVPHFRAGKELAERVQARFENGQ